MDRPVDWIVEAPYTEVPNFGSVKFTNISAGTKNHVIDLFTRDRHKYLQCACPH
jgi:hypothetical protein